MYLMMIGPKTSKTPMGHYMFVFGNIVIWIRLDFLPLDVNLLGHLNWDEFTHMKVSPKASKMMMGRFVWKF